MNRKIIPGVMSQNAFDEKSLYHLAPTDTVQRAVEYMAEQKIGVVVILDKSEKLVGIFSERDLLNRVVNEGRNLEKTQLNEVMTSPVKTVTPNDELQYAMKLMDQYNCRHLPVVNGDSVIGMISIKDLYSALVEDLNDDLKQREAFIHGTAY